MGLRLRPNPGLRKNGAQPQPAGKRLPLFLRPGRSADEYGILTFINRATELHQLFGEQHAAFYDTNEELVEKIHYYQKDDEARRRIAAQGRRFYWEHFSAEKIADYIIRKTMHLDQDFEYIWKPLAD